MDKAFLFFLFLLYLFIFFVFLFMDWRFEMKFVRVYRGCDSNGDGGGGTWGESNLKKKKNI